MSVSSVLGFYGDSICSTKVKSRWSLKLKKKKKKWKWNTSLYFMDLFCHCISSASERKNLIISPRRAALSGTVEKWTALIVLIILAHVCSWLPLKVIWNMKLNHPWIKPIQTEAHHHFKFSLILILTLQKCSLEYIIVPFYTRTFLT